MPLTDATESPTTPATPSIVELLPVAPVPVVDLPAIPTSPAPLPTADDAPAPTPGLPRLSELMRFCLPTLGIWLSAPMLSLIDTSMVGIACSPIELAALGPSTKVCDYLAFFFTFLGAATTNLAADAFARKQPEQAQRVVGGTSRSRSPSAAPAVGLSAAAAPLMASMLGRDPRPVGGATQYTAIRALGYPAALATMVLQARSCRRPRRARTFHPLLPPAPLAFPSHPTPPLSHPLPPPGRLPRRRDTRSPMLAPRSSASPTSPPTPSSRAMGMGVAGAAATVLRSTSTPSALAPAPQGGRAFAAAAADAAEAAASTAAEAAEAAARRVAPRMLVKPSRAELAALWGSRADDGGADGASRSGLAHATATARGTMALASHQVVESLYWLFCPLGEVSPACRRTCRRC